jgi:hypothetical protein
MRRKDIEEVLGTVEAPDVAEAHYLVDILFKVGPVRSEGPVYEENLQAWETRRGIELQPWQADLILEMSQAYFSEMHAAREPNALAPWPPARSAWKYVRDQLDAAGMRAALKEPLKGQHGNRK